MRKTIHSTILICVCVFQTGCVNPQYSPDRESRDRDYQGGEAWERIWADDEPDRETPYRSHGGVI